MGRLGRDGLGDRLRRLADRRRLAIVDATMAAYAAVYEERIAPHVHQRW